MKKLMAPNSAHLTAKLSRGALVLLFAGALSLALWTTAAAVGRETAPAQNIQSTSPQTQSDKEKDADKSKEGDKEGDKGHGEGDKEKKCIVCSKGKDKSVDCGEVDEWLEEHPGDKRGRCQPTPVTNR
jgi:cytoskeletal protein RodZ